MFHPLQIQWESHTWQFEHDFNYHVTLENLPNLTLANICEETNKQKNAKHPLREWQDYLDCPHEAGLSFSNLAKASEPCSSPASSRASHELFRNKRDSADSSLENMNLFACLDSKGFNLIDCFELECGKNSFWTWSTVISIFIVRLLATYNCELHLKLSRAWCCIFPCCTSLCTAHLAIRILYWTVFIVTSYIRI